MLDHIASTAADPIIGFYHTNARAQASAYRSNHTTSDSAKEGARLIRADAG
jgi:hypothetical protein